MSVALLVLRLLLAVTFLVAGAAKLGDLDGSRAALAGFGVPERAAWAGGGILPLVELVVGGVLLPSTSARLGALGAAILLAAFCTAIVRSMRRGLSPPCHCFGQLHSEPAGLRTLARNAGLLVLATLILVLPHDRLSAVAWLWRLDATQALALSLGMVVAAAVAFGYALLRQHGRLLMRIDELERGHSRPTLAHGLSVGAIAPPFSELAAARGSVTLVFADPGCGSCNLVLDRLAADPARDDVIVISPRPVSQQLGRVLLDPQNVLRTAYRLPGTPAAVLIDADRRIASPPAAGPAAIAELLTRSAAPTRTDTDERRARRASQPLEIDSATPRS